MSEIEFDLLKLRAVQFEILKQIIKVCDKYALSYFAAYGTLLGAVRHKGFIPWDDDIDIMMPRPDYDKFCEIVKEELSYPYFLLTSANEYKYSQKIGKMQNLATTCIQKWNRNIDMKKGIYVDIYPLDGCENTLIGKWRYDFYRRLHKYYCLYPEMTVGEKIKFCLWKITALMLYGKCPRKFLHDKLTQLVPFEEAEFVANDPRDDIFPKEAFAEAILADFEDTKIKIPVGYDLVLKKCYGDYMKLPPKEEQTYHHDFVIIDTEKSYTEYLK